MLNHRRILFALLVLCSSVATYAQKPLGEWQFYPSYTAAYNVLEAGSKLYCATSGGLFFYDRADNTVQTMGEFDGLSDLQVRTMAYSDSSQKLILVYDNCNIDVLYRNQVYNIPELKLKTITGAKYVNQVFLHGDLAYLCCPFGIVVVDLDRMEIKDAYYPGINNTPVEVLDLTIAQNKFYAATANGVYEASLNDPFLSDASHWTRQDTLTTNATYLPVRYIVSSNDHLYSYWNYKVRKFDNGNWVPVNWYVNNHFLLKAKNDKLLFITNYSVDLYSNVNDAYERSYYFYNDSSGITNATYTNDGYIWQCDRWNGLLRTDGASFAQFLPKGPYSASSVRLECDEQKVLVAPAAMVTTGDPTFNTDGGAVYESGNWTNYLQNNRYNKVTSFYDVQTARVNPTTKKIMMGSGSRGLAVIGPSGVEKHYNADNSPLKKLQGDTNRCCINDMAFDDKGNTYLVNERTTTPIVKLDKNGNWTTYSFPTAFSTASSAFLERIVIDSYGQKWVTNYKNGVLVFDDRILNNGVPKHRLLTLNSKAGVEYSNDPRCLAVDQEGNVWVGTTKGLYVYYNAATILNEENPAPQQIKVIQDGLVQYLLEADVISSIKVDGGNRKWIGTQNGVWLFSPDGTKSVHYFTSENSPLPSNTINDITIHPSTGEVFFATDKGLISYRGDATAGAETNELAQVFPNPVRPGYNGLITIRGLVTGANVKITDINGTLVYQTVAEGGTATWNKKNFKGEEANSGVYLVFITNEDGTETAVQKIMIIN